MDLSSCRRISHLSAATSEGTPHMPRIYWVGHELAGGGRIAVTARPSGYALLAESVGEWRAAGIDIVVSLQDEVEAAMIGLELEAEACADHGIAFIRFPIDDMGTPELDVPVLALIDDLADRFNAGASIAAHCFAGRGRSPTLVAAVLIRLGLEPADAIARISIARGHTAPETDGQWQWLIDYADRLAEAREVPGPLGSG